MTNRFALLAGAGLLFASASLPAFAGYYVQQNLVTNFPNKYATTPAGGERTTGNGKVLNAWGLAVPPAAVGGAFWFSNNGSGTASIYSGDVGGKPLGQGNLKEVPVAPGDGSATPTGQVFSGSPDFPCAGTSSTGGVVSGPSLFILSTEDGNIQCWTAGASGALASFAISINGDNGSIYKGLAVTHQASGNRLYAANFGLRRVEVYDGNFQPILIHAFTPSADIPTEYAPFNVAVLTYAAPGGPKTSVFVAYAATQEGSEDEADGPGLGLVAEFDTDGTYVRTLQTGVRMNAPWGIALAPANFGRFSNRLLVGNFGDGTIVAFDLTSGDQRGYLRGFDGQAIQIDGLWGIAFGNGTTAGEANRLYYAAGPSGEADGLFGSLHWIPNAPPGSSTKARAAEDADEPALASPPATPAPGQRTRSHRTRSTGR